MILWWKVAFADSSLHKFDKYSMMIDEIYIHLQRMLNRHYPESRHQKYFRDERAGLSG